MEIKKGLGFVLAMLGVMVLAQTTVVASADDDDSVSARRGRVFATEHASEESKELYRANRQKRDKEKRRNDKKNLKPAKHEHHEYFCTMPAKEERDHKLYFDFGVGSMKYLVPTVALVDAVLDTDTISLNHSSWVPLVRGGFGVEFIGIPCLNDDGEHTSRVRVGLEVTYAKKKNAIITNYTNEGNATPNLLGVQSVKRGDLMAVAMYDLVRDKIGLEGGLGLVGGSLDDYRLYQPVSTGSTVILPGYYTGQRLVPHKGSFGGFVGVTLAHRCKTADRVRFEFNYRALFNSVSYQTTVYQDQPGLYANQVYQNGFSMSQTAGNALLPQQPSFKVRAQSLSFGVVAEF